MQSRNAYIRNRLEIYEGMERDMEVTWNGNWPTFHFYQGSAVFSLTLPNVYCMIKNHKMACRTIQAMMRPQTVDTKDSNPTDLPKVSKPIKKGADSTPPLIEFDIDIPFK